MAVGGIQIPTLQRQPDLDFSSLAALPQVYQQGQARQGLAALGQGLANGSMDYRQAAAEAAKTGNMGAAMQLLALDEAKKKQALELDASNKFSTSLSGLYPGGGARVPGPTSAAPGSTDWAAQAERYSDTQSSPLDPPSGADRDRAIRTVVAEAGNQGPVGMNAVASVIRNRAVDGGYGGDTPSGVVTAPKQFEPWNDMSGRARMAGIDQNSPQYQQAAQALDSAYFGNDPTNGAKNFYAPKAQAALGRPAPAWDNGRGVDIGDHRFFGGAQGGQPSYQVAQAGGAPPAAPQQPGSVPIPVLLQAMADPNLPAGQREIAKTLFTRALDEAKPPERIKMLKALQADPALMELEEKLRAAGKTTVNIDQKGETKFEEELGKGQAKRWNSYIEGGAAAQKKMVDIQNMRAISERIGAQGAGANVKEAIGPYAEALGVPIEGLSDIQAYSSIVQRLAPQQRAEGSGSTSDIEFKGFLKSLPTLSQNPAARDMTLNTMEALTRDEIARGEIATKLAAKEINRLDAEKALRDLPDPMKSFQEWRKANPALYGQALGGTAPKAAPQGAPKAGHLEDGYRFKGGNPADPNSWIKVQ